MTDDNHDKYGLLDWRGPCSACRYWHEGCEHDGFECPTCDMRDGEYIYDTGKTTCTKWEPREL